MCYEIEFAHSNAEKELRDILSDSNMVIARDIQAYVLIKIDGEIVGGGLLAQIGKDMFHLLAFAVKESVRKRGIGSFVIKELMNKPWKYSLDSTPVIDGRYKVTTVAKGNTSEFFQKNGFVVCNLSELPAPFGEQYCDDPVNNDTRPVAMMYARCNTQNARAFLKRGAGKASSPIMACSGVMQDVVEIARRIAKFDSSVLLTGESGVGKELMARFIHDQSARASRSFVAVNCGALTETLLESELFGHARGAFTGADKEREGLFEAATGGTLFLDEIGEMSPAMQVKLLRVLQEHEIRRVGENRSRSIDVRVVAATNRNLVGEIAIGRFRQDLYYRLRVIGLQMPPLRERHEDILPLAHVFLKKFNQKMGRTIEGFTPTAADQLLRCDWPGNVRELQNTLEYAVAMCLDKNRIDVNDLPYELQDMAGNPVMSDQRIRTLDEIEQEYILWVLRMVRGDKDRAAVELNIGIATLYRRLKKYAAQSMSDIAASRMVDISTDITSTSNKHHCFQPKVTAGTQEASKTISDMNAFIDQVLKAPKTIKAIGTRSNQIASGMEGISDQTNLYVLNAAIAALPGNSSCVHGNTRLVKSIL